MLYHSGLHLILILCRLELEGMASLKSYFAIQFLLFTRLSLGGGMGYLSGEHGLVIDNLIKVFFSLDLGHICPNFRPGYHCYRQWVYPDRK